MDHRIVQRVLVTGATSGVGGEVVRLLAGSGVAVSAMHRRREQAGDLRALGAEPVLADYDDQRSLQAAMKGCSDVFLVTPPLQGQFPRDQRAIDAAVTAGVHRVVRLSASDSNRTTKVPWARDHARADHYLADSGLRWTVLRASGFMENLAAAAPMVRRGFLPQAGGAGEFPLICSDDIAAVAHTVLTTPGHDRATYFLTGPDSLTFSQVAAAMSRHVGHRVRFVHLPGWAYMMLIRCGGQDWWKADGVRRQFADVVRHGHDIDMTHDVERLTGRPATTIDDYLQAHRHDFCRQPSKI